MEEGRRRDGPLLGALRGHLGGRTNGKPLNRPKQIQGLLILGGDGGELNSPSRRRTSRIYYKLSWAFNLALARRPSRLASGTSGNLEHYLPE